MATSVTIKVDQENNAERFWEAFRECYPALEDADPEIYSICRRLAKPNFEELEIVDPATIQRFADFVEGLPGYSDGPEFAKTALIFQAN